MKLKEIKPGMVIHCPKEEDARMLLEYLDKLGYTWLFNGKNVADCDDYCNYYHIHDEYTLSRSEYRPYDLTITEFSDLIEPDDSPADSPMSAVEVLEWFAKHYNKTGDIRKVFGSSSYTFAHLMDYFKPQEIVDKIVAYEAAKKEPEPVEVEGGYACSVYDEDNCYIDYIMWGVDEDTAKDDVIDRAIKQTRATGKQVNTAVHFVCRVKEENNV